MDTLLMGFAPNLPTAFALARFLNFEIIVGSLEPEDNYHIPRRPPSLEIKLRRRFLSRKEIKILVDEVGEHELKENRMFC